jgi:hypothetical protein
MATFLTTALHDGTPWIILVCLLGFAGVVVGVYTRSGSGINAHPYTDAKDGGEMGSDLPEESMGREELEPLLWPRRAGRRARRHRS